MSHGDVVVTRETEAQQSEPDKPGVVAAQTTVSKVSSEKQINELQFDDPWAKPMPKGTKKPPANVQIVRLMIWSRESSMQSSTADARDAEPGTDVGSVVGSAYQGGQPKGLC